MLKQGNECSQEKMMVIRFASPPRRILADFLIGAHALDRGASLATMDEEHYRTAFPKLDLITL